jgi:hypothetical protein
MVRVSVPWLRRWAAWLRRWAALGSGHHKRPRRSYGLTGGGKGPNRLATDEDLGAFAPSAVEKDPRPGVIAWLWVFFTLG